MTIRIYVRASTKDQDATRALNDLHSFADNLNDSRIEYIENESGTKLDRPILSKLLNEAREGDTLLVESVDRLSRLTQTDFNIKKGR
jgi:DNA invertase Pin-like site-specific DNA recombinase